MQKRIEFDFIIHHSSFVLAPTPALPRKGGGSTCMNYSEYLHLPELLALQQPRSRPPEHDEHLFIVIHQVFELWFKLLLHELEKVCRDFSGNDLYGAIATIHRGRTILKTLVGQLDILETMTPMSFASFRDRLETSSGFQSRQFRELEFLLGIKRPDVLQFFGPTDPGHEQVQRRLRERSIVDHFYDFLVAQGETVPPELLARDVTQPTAPDPVVQAALLRLYKARPDLAILFERMTDFDEGLQEWRYRHVKI